MNARKNNIIDSLAEELHQKRLAIVGGVDETEGELKKITQEQEPELEEEAQKERIAAVLERLSDRDRQALEEIDGAIKRIVSGTYGRCDACGRPIALARLRALPTTRLCIDCARAQEGKDVGSAEKEAAEDRPPSDMSLLDDEEGEPGTDAEEETEDIVRAVQEAARYRPPSSPPPLRKSGTRSRRAD